MSIPIKTDRPSAPLKLKGPDAPAGPAIVAPVAEVKTTQAPENLFGTRSKALDPVTGPDGKAVSSTASAAALWGAAALSSARPPLIPKNLSPTEVNARVADLKTKQGDLEKRINGRVGELDAQWNQMRLTTRTDVLKGYMAESNSLTPEVRSHLEGAIKQSETAQANLQSLSAEAKTLPPSRGADEQTKADRSAMAAKLWAARHDHQAAVTTATATVDNAGLKIERLALTESKIDPSGGQNSKYGSMTGLLGQYFETTFMLGTLDKIYLSPTVALTAAIDKQSKDDQKRQIVEDEWRQRDDLMRNMLKDLSTKEVSAKRDVAKSREAGRTGIPGAKSRS